jgi:hypothetical protein
MAITDFSGWKPGDAIGYIRRDIPDFEFPPYEGERYEATVPDTLDLQERARLAIHGMTEITDPLADYEPYWIAYFRSKPPQMIHNCWQTPGLPKMLGALSLMRIMSGSEENLHVEERWMEVLLKSLGPDGLIYSPVGGRPWAHRGFPLLGFELDQEQILSPFAIGAALTAMAVLAGRDRGPMWRDALGRLVDGAIGLAVDAGEYAYFWPSANLALKEPPQDVSPLNRAFESEISVVPRGLVHAYRTLGYQPALTLARKLINYMRRYFYGADGTFFSTPGNPRKAHFHAHSRGLLAMLDYAQVSDDQEMIEFALRSFEWARRLGTNLESQYPSYDVLETPGSNLVGYFPEWTNSPEWEQSETCEVADMIGVALRLSEAGVGDYWDDADRWVRNQLAEAQLLETDWIYRVLEVGATNPETACLMPSVVGPYDTADRVPERLLGAFAGNPGANDSYTGNSHGIGHCCTINGSRGLYWVWERILRHEAGKLQVNLLLNRASPWADVDSCVPYQGRVDVKVKRPVDLSIRIPEWVAPAETRCQVNGKERELGWDGRYAQVGETKPGDVATLCFPICERTDVVHIEKQRFTLLRRGNEVVSIEPPGRYHPLYQRQHYRKNTPRWRKLTRFVGNEESALEAFFP